MKKSDAREVCKNLNIVRDNNCNRDLTKGEVTELLKGIVPGVQPYFYTAVKYGLVEKKGYGNFRFSTEPVYIGRVESYLKEYRSRVAENKKKSAATPVENNQPEIIDEEDAIAMAISTLKETGDYKVYKKVVKISWEEV